MGRKVPLWEAEQAGSDHASQGEYSKTSEPENYRGPRSKGKERTKNMRSEEGETAPHPGARVWVQVGQ